MTIPELAIDDVIGAGWFGGVGARYVNRFLREHAKAKEILVRVNSPGGDVFEGVAIYTALKNFEGTVTVDIEGMAASAASYISMAGDKIRVHKGAMFMIHEASGGTWGRASEHEARAVLLRKINDEITDLYAARTGIDREKLVKMLDDETWLTAEESLAMGFCDSIVPAKSKPAKTSKAAAHLVSSFKHAPMHALAAFGRHDDAPQSAPVTIQKITAVKSPLGEFAPAKTGFGDF